MKKINAPRFWRNELIQNRQEKVSKSNKEKVKKSCAILQHAGNWCDNRMKIAAFHATFYLVGIVFGCGCGQDPNCDL